jgi:acetate kinase
MNNNKAFILAINSGSSSIKFSLYQDDKSRRKLFYGKIDRIGMDDPELTFTSEKGIQKGVIKTSVSNHQSAGNFLIDFLEKQVDFSLINGIGHRIVFGMKHTNPQIITKELLNDLDSLSPFDMDHLPDEIKLIEIFLKRYPDMHQVACFDTAFHSSMPRVAQLLPIPRRFDSAGVHRYGFHGLSYAYLMEELAHIAGKKAAKGKVILAHLGNGASMAAVHNNKSVDTTMGFTPAGGMIMGSRPGDLDPGVAWYMLESENLTPKQFNNLISHESGLLGISGTSSDMRDLLAKESDDIRASEAVALFCYQAKKWLGAYAAALGGVDTLIFAGGIGENCPVVRSRICDGLEFLGIQIEKKQNMDNSSVISTNNGKVTIRIIHTDEELMIAKTVKHILNHNIKD